jgi:acetoacetyl-CoA synthetase
VGHNSPSKLVETLTRIWQRVLQRPSVDVEDNFFEVGGNAAVADRLFAEIARECGRNLPSATIYHTQTIASLAAAMKLPTLPRFLPFVRMKPGEGAPVIIAHGLEGSVQFFGLAASMETSHPVYGIQAQGIDGLKEPLERVEDMAKFYLDSIKQFQPHGPYVLIGYSFGGLIALEMAQAMSAQGESVAVLALVDAYPHPRYMPWGQRVRLWAQRTRRRVSEVRRRPTQDATTYVMSGLKRRLQISERRGLGAETSLSFRETIFGVKEKAYIALARYRPRPYGGKIKFVKSESDTFFPGDPVAAWANFASNMEVETVRGAHLDMVTTHHEVLAAVLTRYVRDAFGEE